MLTVNIEDNYKLIKELGQGSYGVVVSAQCNKSLEKVAIKKISKVFDKKILTKRTLREIKLLKHLDHENIVNLKSVEVQNHLFNEVFLIQELMEADLHTIIRSSQPITDKHIQYFIYQLVKGVKYIHSANIIHRDLKPGNLLVNSNCKLKICDFGLARGYESSDDVQMTEYIATRWYRAPEVMLCNSYTKAIDIWSIGCILAELLQRKTLFKGMNYIDQLQKILKICGNPNELELNTCSSRAKSYLSTLEKTPKVPFESLFPEANKLAIDLLESILVLDASKRPTAEDILSHPYLARYATLSEPVCPDEFEFDFEKVDDPQILKNLIMNEISI